MPSWDLELLECDECREIHWYTIAQPVKDAHPEWFDKFGNPSKEALAEMDKLRNACPKRWCITIDVDGGYLASALCEEHLLEAIKAIGVQPKPEDKPVQLLMTMLNRATAEGRARLAQGLLGDVMVAKGRKLSVLNALKKTIVQEAGPDYHWPEDCPD